MIVRTVKEYIRNAIARVGLARVYARVRLWQGKNVNHLFLRTRGERFSAIYTNKVWLNERSDGALSGLGSELARTNTVRQQLPSLLANLGVRTLLDIGCGDWNWMRELRLDCEYIGADIVNAVIARNAELYTSDKVRFVCLDAVEDTLPESDAVLCRDVLFHLSFEDINHALANVCRTRARFLIATSDMGTAVNSDIITGDFRLLNLRKQPLAFPAPTVQIIDNEVSSGKILGVWKIEDVKAAISRA